MKILKFLKISKDIFLKFRKIFSWNFQSFWIFWKIFSCNIEIFLNVKNYESVKSVQICKKYTKLWIQNRPKTVKNEKLKMKNLKIVKKCSIIKNYEKWKISKKKIEVNILEIPIFYPQCCKTVPNKIFGKKFCNFSFHFFHKEKIYNFYDFFFSILFFVAYRSQLGDRSWILHFLGIFILEILFFFQSNIPEEFVCQVLSRFHELCQKNQQKIIGEHCRISLFFFEIFKI